MTVCVYICMQLQSMQAGHLYSAVMVQRLSDANTWKIDIVRCKVNTYLHCRGPTAGGVENVAYYAFCRLAFVARPNVPE